MRIERENGTIKNAYWRQLQKGPNGIVECRVPMSYGNPMNTPAGTGPWAASTIAPPEPNNVGLATSCMFMFARIAPHDNVWKHTVFGNLYKIFLNTK